MTWHIGINHVNVHIRINNLQQNRIIIQFDIITIQEIEIGQNKTQLKLERPVNLNISAHHHQYERVSTSYNLRICDFFCSAQYDRWFSEEMDTLSIIE